MRPNTFDAKTLRQCLLRHKIATLPELKRALSTQVDLTVFRKLKPLGYLSSYTHRGGYYTLTEIARFDDKGLWSHEAVWFSRYGTLLATVETFVNRSPQGFFASDLADALHVEVHDALRQLVEQGRLHRTEVSGLYLYTAIDCSTHRQQFLTRRTMQSVPVVADVSASKSRPRNSKPPFCSSTACSTSSSGVFTRAWNPSSLAVAGMLCWPISWLWKPTRWPEDASTCSIMMLPPAAEPAARVAGALRRKKNV